MRAPRWVAGGLLAATLLAAGGCTAWRRVARLDPERQLPADVRVTRRDGRTVAMHDPQVVRDSIMGTRPDSGFAPVAIALDDVERVEGRRFSVVRSTLLVLIALGAFLGVLSALG